MLSKEEIENMKKYFNECIEKDTIHEEDLTLNFIKTAREYIEQLETEIANHVYWESTPVNEIKKMYIPKDKIREKIEENNKLIEECKEDEEHCGEIYLYEHDNKILKELLEEK